jgi:hypothetical protein
MGFGFPKEWREALVDLVASPAAAHYRFSRGDA